VVFAIEVRLSKISMVTCSDVIINKAQASQFPIAIALFAIAQLAIGEFGRQHEQTTAAQSSACREHHGGSAAERRLFENMTLILELSEQACTKPSQRHRAFGPHH
jgi:hypothetical protein